MNTQKIAIIGTAYRLPGDIDNDLDLWNALLNKRDAVTEVPEARFNKAKFYHQNQNRKGKSYTFSAGLLSDYNSFDYSFFNISAKEAAQMDPQHLLLLETTWRALENSGCDPNIYRGKKCGVFVGISSLDFAVSRGADVSSTDMHSSTGTVISIAANRISYFFDFKGPSMSIDTACSSSLVALHQASLSLKAGEIEAAIVCGINYLGNHNFFITQSKANMLSPDGRCKSFSNEANGYVRSEGCVAIVLKRFNDALHDNNLVQGLILNTCVNSDGKTNGLPMPSQEAQQKLLSDVYGEIHFNPSDLSYIEAHGTGTKIGDPVEVLAISQGLALKRQKPLPIGSIKSNIGHLEPAAGLASLIKGLLCIKHRKIPPTIHCSTLNTNIDFEKSNVMVVRDLYDLNDNGREIVIGVNSFGFGGTNAHAIISEYKHSINTRDEVILDSKHQIPVLLTAQNEKSLKETALCYAKFINENGNLYEIAYNLFNFRAKHKFYAITYGSSKDEVVRSLESYGNSSARTNDVYTGTIIKNTGKTVLVFSGNGCQWGDMGKSILEQSPKISSYMDEVDNIFSGISGYSLIDKIKFNDDPNIYARTELAQPALFMLQVAILKYLQSYGFKYDAVIGHSVGEVAAAWACGVLSLVDATKLIFFRSKAQSLTKGYGKMAVLGLNDSESKDVIKELGLNNLIEIAGTNSPKSTTLSGVESALLRVQDYAVSKDVYFQLLDLDYPFHSRFMDEAKESFIGSIGDNFKLQKSEVSFISTVYGKLIDGVVLDSSYWWDNLRKPVKFRDGIEFLLSNDCSTFIEIGPHPILLRSVGQCSEKYGLAINLIPSLQKDSNELLEINNLLSKLIASDCNLNTNFWFPYPSSKLELPGYCWDRKEIVHPASFETLNAIDYRIEHPLLGWRIAGGERIWENHFDATNCMEIKDHVVGNSIIFPAAGFIEMAVAAHSLTNNSELGYIEGFQLLAPLVLEEDVTLHLQFKLGINGYFEIRSRPRLTELDWTVNAKGRIVEKSYYLEMEESNLNRANNIPKLIVYPEDLYNSASGISLNYGKGFQLVSKVKLFDNECAADIQTPLYEGEYIFGPSIIDSGLHCAIPLISSVLKRYGNLKQALYLPASCETILFANKKKTIKQSIVRLSSISDSAARMDVFFYDNDGKTVMSFRDFRLNRSNINLQNSELPELCEYRPILISSLNRSAVENVNNRIYKNFKLFTYNTSRHIVEIYHGLDSLSISYIVEGIKRIFPNDFDPNEIYKETEFGKLYWFLNLLLKEGYLFKKENEIYAWDTEREIISSNDIFKLLVDTYPETLPEVLHISRLGMQMDKYLIGEANVDEIVSINGGLYQSMLRESILIKPSLSSFGECYKRFLGFLKRNEKVSILEIGSGMFFHLLEDIPSKNFDNVSYSLFTFDEKMAGKIAKGKPNINVKFINTNENFSDKIFDHQFNLIVCSDLYALAYKNEALNNISNLLMDGGTLLINEYKPCISQFLLNGLKPYTYNSFIKEKSKPAIYSVKTWENTLINLGLRLVRSSSEVEENDLGRFTSIFKKKANKDKKLLLNGTTESAGNLKSLSILFLYGSNSDQANCIGKYLKKNCGHLVFQSYTKKSYRKKSFEEFDEIVVLPNKEIALEDTRTDFILMNLAKDIATYKTKTKKPILSLLCSGGSLCNDRDGLNLERNPKHASLWGLMRVISNEYGNYLDTLMMDNQTKILPDEFTGLFTRRNEEIIITSDSCYGLKIVPIQKEINLSKQSENKYNKLELRQKGSLNNLQWKEKIKQPLGNNNVAIRPMSVGLNFRDIMYSLGLIPEEAVENSSVGPCLGLDLAGIVLAVGQGVTEFQGGDRVMGGAPSSLADYTIADKNTLIKLPDSWGYNEGATIFTVFLTAYYSLVHLAQIRKGEKVLIHCATGGVGIASIQIAQYMGAEIFATAGNQEKRDFLKLLEVKHIYDSHSLYFAEQILKDTGNVGVDVVLNSLAGEAIHASCKTLKPFGRFIEIGKRDIYENNMLGLKSLKNNISYFCVNVEQLMLWKNDLGMKILKKLSDFFNNGTLKPLPYIVYPASGVIEALKFLQDGKNIGKVIVDFSGNCLTSEIKEKQKKLKGYYLITGGTSGFGLETAKYLIEKGVEGVILLSRSGEIDNDNLNWFLGKKAKLKIFFADVTSFENLQNIFDTIKREGINLKGIVHAATLYHDEMINNLAPEHYEKILFTKIKGAYYLDELSREFSLDNFIAYSSVSTFFGNIGQASYVAANAFLESLVLKRISLGLKANYLALGGLKDVGILNRNVRLKKILSEKLGDSLISSKQALSALGKVINGSTAGFSVMNFDLLQMEKTLPMVKTSRFDILKLSERKTVHSEDTNFKERIKFVTKAEAKKELTSIVVGEIANILGLHVTEVNENRPLREYGLDSLMGFDLAMSIEKRTSINMSSISLHQTANAENIVDMLLAKLLVWNEETEEDKKSNFLRKHGEIS